MRAAPKPFASTPFEEYGGTFSPDGRWVAYASNESGRYEIYVQAFPVGGGKRQISVEGGGSPTWSRDGHELFFQTQGYVESGMMVCERTVGNEK